jgi:ABC-type uncharacterized transport system substrate-binding protein
MVKGEEGREKGKIATPNNRSVGFTLHPSLFSVEIVHLKFPTSLGFKTHIMFRLFFNLLLASTIALLPTIVCAEKLTVRLLLSDNTPTYQQFSVAFNKALAANNTNVTVVSTTVGSIPQNESKVDLTIAVGLKAVEYSSTNIDTPLLSVMIPKMAYELMHKNRQSHHLSGAMSALYLEQPWSRQLNFIRTILPNRNVVGLLYTPDAQPGLPRPLQGMSVYAQPVKSSETLFETLENVFENSKLLLITQDSDIYTSQNVRNILLTSYKYKIPVIGTSPAYVSAGALCALYATPTQFATQTAEIVTYFENNHQLPEPQHPNSYSISVNQPVSHSLEIQLDTPEAIRERMLNTSESKP